MKKKTKYLLNYNCLNKIKIPAIFIAGKADWGIYQKPGEYENMKKFFTNNFKVYLIEKAGHWQQENPEQTFKIMKNFYNLNK